MIWYSRPLAVLRWVLFIPAGIALAYLSALAVQASFHLPFLPQEWTFWNSDPLHGVSLYVVGIILAYGLMFWVARLAVSIICPRPRLGAIIYCSIAGWCFFEIAMGWAFHWPGLLPSAGVTIGYATSFCGGISAFRAAHDDFI
jgi:hypothetical protein